MIDFNQWYYYANISHSGMINSLSKFQMVFCLAKLGTREKMISCRFTFFPKFTLEFSYFYPNLLINICTCYFNIFNCYFRILLFFLCIIFYGVVFVYPCPIIIYIFCFAFCIDISVVKGISVMIKMHKY